MSSAGRGPRLGGDHDYYETPKWPVDRLLDVWCPPGGRWLEPNAGRGAIIRAVNSRRSDVEWSAVEIRSEEEESLVSTGASVVIDDFVSNRADHGSLDVVITNPAFLIAMDVILRARELAPLAWQAFLLRLDFVGSDERAPFMQQHPPDVFPLPDRPSFRGDGADSIYYGWFVWPPPCRGSRTYGNFKVLASTPLEERKRIYMPSRSGRTFEPKQLGIGGIT